MSRKKISAGHRSARQRADLRNIINAALNSVEDVGTMRTSLDECELYQMMSGMTTMRQVLGQKQARAMIERLTNRAFSSFSS